MSAQELTEIQNKEQPQTEDRDDHRLPQPQHERVR
jgi:hypothetical protein